MSVPLDPLFAALSNSKRRSLLLSLASRPHTVSQLAESHHLSLPAIHRHVRDLETAGLIHRKKVGRSNYLAIRRAGVRAAQAWLTQFHAYWGNDEETLSNYPPNLP